jgi:hypothetical protein
VRFNTPRLEGHFLDLQTVTPLKEIAMTKNTPAVPDATLTLLTVAEASEISSPQEGTIFDLSLLGALLFGEPIAEALIDEVAPERRH